MYGISIFVFAFGVGGEYPMTSTNSMEKYHGRQDRLHRGRNVLLAFLMQGWGQLFNQISLIIILYAFKKTLESPYTEIQTQVTFRLAFALAALFLAYFLFLRVRNTNGVESKSGSSPYDLQTLKLIGRHYWTRILATSLCWFCSDFPFYGNQIFRNDLLQLVTGAPPDDVSILWLYNLINIGCELLGYYLAAILIDHKGYGRRNMQLVGFGAMFVLFATVAIGFPVLNQKGLGATIFQAIFFFSNFWVNFGPNSTTFLIAGEVYPKSVRASIHGFSAAVGKMGALLATVLFNYIEDRTKFILVTICTLIGFILTFLFIPDTTGLNLSERERYWQAVANGTGEEYHGAAVHPQHVSWYERVVLKRSDLYDSELDRMTKLAELRKQYKQAQRNDDWQTVSEGQDDCLDPNMVKYFELESSGMTRPT